MLPIRSSSIRQSDVPAVDFDHSVTAGLREPSPLALKASREQSSAAGITRQEAQAWQQKGAVNTLSLKERGEVAREIASALPGELNQHIGSFFPKVMSDRADKISPIVSFDDHQNIFNSYKNVLIDPISTPEDKKAASVALIQRIQGGRLDRLEYFHNLRVLDYNDPAVTHAMKSRGILFYYAHRDYYPVNIVQAYKESQIDTSIFPEERPAVGQALVQRIGKGKFDNLMSLSHLRSIENLEPAIAAVIKERNIPALLMRAEKDLPDFVQVYKEIQEQDGLLPEDRNAATQVLVDAIKLGKFDDKPDRELLRDIDNPVPAIEHALKERSLLKGVYRAGGTKQILGFYKEIFSDPSLGASTRQAASNVLVYAIRSGLFDHADAFTQLRKLYNPDPAVAAAITKRNIPARIIQRSPAYKTTDIYKDLQSNPVLLSEDRVAAQRAFVSRTTPYMPVVPNVAAQSHVSDAQDLRLQTLYGEADPAKIVAAYQEVMSDPKVLRKDGKAATRALVNRIHDGHFDRPGQWALLRNIDKADSSITEAMKSRNIPVTVGFNTRIGSALKKQTKAVGHSIKEQFESMKAGLQRA